MYATRYIFMPRAVIKPGYTYMDMDRGMHKIYARGAVIPTHYPFELEENAAHSELYAPQMVFTGDGWRWHQFPRAGDIITDGAAAFHVESVTREEMIVVGVRRQVHPLLFHPYFLKRTPVIQFYCGGWKFTV